MCVHFNPHLFKVSIIQTKLFGPLDFELSRFHCIRCTILQDVFRVKSAYLPISTDGKNKCTGTFSMGDAMLRNQFGDIGNSRKNNRKKNKLSIFSST